MQAGHRPATYSLAGILIQAYYEGLWWECCPHTLIALTVLVKRPLLSRHLKCRVRPLHHCLQLMAMSQRMRYNPCRLFKKDYN